VVQTAEGGKYFGAQHIVQVDEGIKLKFALCVVEKLPQAFNALIFLLEVYPHHLEVGRGVEKYRGHGVAGDEREIDFGVAATGAVDYRHGHGNVAKGREACYQHVFQLAGVAFTHRAASVAVPEICCHRFKVAVLIRSVPPL
jgi:hypothetical protein